MTAELITAISVLVTAIASAITSLSVFFHVKKVNTPPVDNTAAPK